MKRRYFVWSNPCSQRLRFRPDGTIIFCVCIKVTSMTPLQATAVNYIRFVDFRYFQWKFPKPTRADPVLLVLVLVLVLKESLRTKFQSLFWSLSLMVKSLSLSWSLLPKSLMNCPWFCTCVQCYFKGNYMLSNAELITYLHSLCPSHLLCSSVYSVRQLRLLPWRGFFHRVACLCGLTMRKWVMRCWKHLFMGNATHSVE